jgi:hypothetical protein
MASDFTMAAGLNEFRIGNVFSRTFNLLSRYAAVPLMASFIQHIPNLQMLASAPTPRTSGLIFFKTMLGLLAYILMQPVTYHATLEAIQGRQVGYGEAIRYALRRFFPGLGTELCVGVVAGAGLVLLIVPGIMVAVAFAVAFPVCVIEQQGPFASLRRSRALTKGNRWKICGIYLVMLIVGVVVVGIASIIGRSLGAQVGGFVSVIMQIVTSAFSGVLFTVIYHDLRAAREGLDTNRLAAVFD